MGIDLQMEQLRQAAGIGRREETRYEDLVKQLQLVAQEGRAEEYMRETQREGNQMAMAMMMALSGLKQSQGATMGRPIPPSSMIGMMR
jgi:hypothetical protein